MILTRANLIIAQNAESNDAATSPELMCLHLEHDGTTVAADRYSIVACSPIGLERIIAPRTSDEMVRPSATGVSIPLDVVSDTLRNMPRAAKDPESQLAVLTKCDSQRVGFTTVDRSKEKSVAGRPIQQAYPEWRGVITDAIEKSRNATGRRRVAVKRKRLIQMLQLMDSVCDHDLVFIEFGSEDDSLILRSMHITLKQRIVAMLRPVVLEQEDWALSVWEHKLFSLVRRVGKYLLKRKEQ